jgi:hypothetical protein
MLLQLTNQTFGAGEGTPGNTFCRVIGRHGRRFGLFGSENSAMTMGGLDRGAVDDEDEQESGYDPR